MLVSSIFALPTSLRLLKLSCTLQIFLFMIGVQYPTVINPTVSNFTRRAYDPITTQRGLVLRCNHERLRLKRVERKRIGLENHLARICQNICDDVAAIYDCSL